MKFFACVCSLVALSIATAQVPTPPQQAAALQKRLSTLILPNVAFQDATLEEAVEYLRLKCREADSNENPTARGCNFVLLTTSEKPLTLQLRSVPAAEAVRFITELAGLSYVVEPHAIVIGPKGFQMRNPPPNQHSLDGGPEEQSQFILYPAVQFENATVTEACDYLLYHWRGSGQYAGEPPPENIIVKNAAESSTRLISINLKNIPQTDILRYFAELSGLKLRYDREAIVLAPEGDPVGQIELRGKAAEKLRADQIVLPTASFENVSPADVVAFVRQKSAELDPAKKGVNVVIAPGIDPKAVCSLDVRRMSVTEVLRYSAALMGLKLIADDHAFLLAPK